MVGPCATDIQMVELYHGQFGTDVNWDGSEPLLSGERSTAVVLGSRLLFAIRESAWCECWVVDTDRFRGHAGSFMVIGGRLGNRVTGVTTSSLC